MPNSERSNLIEILNESRKDIAGRQIIVWGVGNTAKLYRENLIELEMEGLNIVCYADSKFRGGEFNGKPVISPQEIGQMRDVFVIICSMNPVIIAEIQKKLAELEIEGELIDSVIFSRHDREVMEVYDMLEDRESKRVYASLIEARMKGTNPSEDIVTEDQYYVLPQFAEENTEEILIECGAFNGDTLEAYIRKKNGKFGKIISFEPVPDNIREADKRVKRLLEEYALAENKVTLYPYAVGDKEGKALIMRSETNSGNLSQIKSAESGDGRVEKEWVRTVMLDEFLKGPYSFLKADVEGYENKVLHGAEQGIKRYKPLLAICIYHNAMDFYGIPLLIKKMVPEYKMAIRHHKETLSETVVYARIDR